MTKVQTSKIVQQNVLNLPLLSRYLANILALLHSDVVEFDLVDLITRKGENGTTNKFFEPGYKSGTYPLVSKV